jgi:anthranilate synthase component 2
MLYFASKIKKRKRMRVFVIDNYDSFTFNLVHYLEKYCDEVRVVRNDEVDINDIYEYDRILISPGPGLPSEFPIINKVLDVFAEIKPILGVCLGMQAIAEYYGGKIYNLAEIMHGVPEKTFVVDKEDDLFKDVPEEFFSGRYHSWAVGKNDFPDELLITSVDEKDVLMGLRHCKYNIRAVQFHPESVMTDYGEKMIENWLKYC